jgi:hypothetical protein
MMPGIRTVKTAGRIAEILVVQELAAALEWRSMGSDIAALEASGAALVGLLVTFSQSPSSTPRRGQEKMEESQLQEEMILAIERAFSRGFRTWVAFRSEFYSNWRCPKLEESWPQQADPPSDGETYSHCLHSTLSLEASL